MSERTILMELVESAESVEPDWNDALKRAGYGGGYLPRREEPFRRRRAVLLVAAVLVLLYIVSAVAADSPHGVVYWLFDRSPKTYPVLQEPQLGEWAMANRTSFGFVQTDKGLVPSGTADPQVWSVPVIQGEVAGQGFEMEVYIGRGNHLSVGLNPGGPAKPLKGMDIPQLAGGAGGFPIYGLEPDTGPLGLHWVGWTLSVPGPIEPTGGGTGPKYMYGPRGAERAAGRPRRRSRHGRQCAGVPRPEHTRRERARLGRGAPPRPARGHDRPARPKRRRAGALEAPGGAMTPAIHPARSSDI
jgi:hypothetical protein